MIKKAFPILALAMFSSILGMGIIAPLLPIYVESMGATGIWLGTIMAAFGATSTISAPVFGRLSDRKGRKLLLWIGLLSFSTISLGYIVAGDATTLTMVRALHGAASGMVIPVAMAYIGDVSPEGEEGKWMGYANAAFFSGFGFGPLVGGTVTDHFGMTVTFLFMAGLNFIAFLITLLFLPEVTARQTKTESGRPSFRDISKSSMIKGIFALRIGQAVGRACFTTFLPVFAATYLGLSLTSIGVLLTMQVLLMSALSPVGGRIADRYSRKGLVVFGSLLYAIVIGLIPQGGNFWLLFILSASMSLAGMISMPAASALTIEEGRRYGMGSTMAIFHMGMNIGMAVGPVTSGAIVDLAGIDAAFYFGGAVCLLGIVLFIRLTKTRLAMAG